VLTKVKLTKPDKILLIGKTESVERIFLYFNKEMRDSYPEHPLSDESNKLIQVAGFCQDVPILAFGNQEASQETFESAIKFAVNNNENVSIGVVTSLDKKEDIKEFETHLKMIANTHPEIVSRIVFLIDFQKENKDGIPIPGEKEGYGPNDFLPLDLLTDHYSDEVNRYKDLVKNILNDNLYQRIIAAFDVLFYPISTENNVGLDPASVALIMESDS